MPTVTPAIASWAPFLWYAVAALSTALAVVAALTVFFVSRKRQSAKPAPKRAPWSSNPEPDATSEPLAQPWPPFRQRRRLIFDVRAAYQQLLGADIVHEHPYTIPWFVLLGPADAHPRQLSDALESAEQIGPSTKSLAAQGYRVVFAKEGALVEVDPVLLDAPGWNERWEFLLWLLRGARPQRPADGLVVAIPLEWLVGSNALPPDRLSDRGAQLYEAIWHFQRRTGLRPPVYLVLTGAEQLRGFANLQQTIAIDWRDELFGWSTPNTRVEEFDPRDVSQAVAELAAGVSTVQLRLFGNADASVALHQQRRSAIGEFFLLPAELRRLAEPLQLFLSAMLRPSVYHEPFLFRGFYLTGSKSAPGDAPAFVRGLFHRKIFREFQMTRPATGIVNARNKNIRIAQACLLALVLLGALGLWRLNVVAAERVNGLTPALADLMNWETQLEPKGATANAPVAGVVSQTADARKLLNDFAFVPSTATSILSPASYLESPDERIVGALGVGYNLFILDAIRDGLERKSEVFRGVAARDPSACGTDAGSGVTVNAAQFHDGVASLQQLDASIATYNTLNAGKAISAEQAIGNLKNLANYSLNISLSSDFEHEAELYRAALKQTHPAPLDMNGIRGNVHTQVLNGLLAAIADRYDAAQITAGLAAITDLTGQIGAQGQAAGNVGDPLRGLRDRLRAIDNDATGSALAASGGGLGPELEPSLGQLRNVGTDIAPAGLFGELRTKGLQCQRAAWSALADLKGPGGEQVFQQVDGALRLSVPYKALVDGLNQLFAENFMTAPDPADYRPFVASTARMTWDIARVSAAKQSVDRYAAIMSGPLHDAPPEIANPVHAAVQSRLRDYVLDRLGNAHRLEADPFGLANQDDRTRGEISNFAAAAPLLASMASALGQQGLGDAAAQINSVGATQARRLLEELTRQFDRDALYQPVDRSFAWWNGTTALTSQSFGVANAGDLASWLAVQRNTVSALATNEAEPLVNYLAEIRNAGASLDGRDNLADAAWSGIVDSLNRYAAKSPSSSLAELESFILTDMDQINLGNCYEKLGAESAAHDYIAERLRELKTDILSRCRTLLHNDLAQRYGLAVDLFNHSLRGHFPFVGSHTAADLTSWADPDDVRRFYRIFEQGPAGPLTALKAVYAAGSPQMLFIDQMEALRPALAPLLADPVPGQPASWTAVVEFRADRDLERAGEAIIAWSLTSPAGSAGSQQDKSTLDWSFGEHVKFALGWAQNASTIPAPNPAGEPATQGLSAVWSYNNPWGLFALLENLGAANDATLPATMRKPGLLELTVPLAKNAQAAQGGDPPQSSARVFVRLKLNTVEHQPGQPDKLTPVTLAQFPSTAPAP